MKDARQVALCVLPAALVACLIAAPSVAQAQSFNTATGVNALANDSTGAYNAAFGYMALYSNTAGGFNTGMGGYALYSNSTASNNTAYGNAAAQVVVVDGNTAVGSFSLASDITGAYNTGIGGSSLGSCTGSNNIGLGYEGGASIGSGDYNIEIGNRGSSSDSGVIRIGTVGRQTAAYILGINGNTASGGVAVYINSNGQLGTVISSRRFKYDINDLGDVSDKLMKLRPVAFRYKKAADDGNHPIQYGLIAEEVAEVSPDLVQYDKEGKPFTVYYNLLTPMLLNEFQKQHRRLDAQQAAMNVQKSDLQVQRSEIDAQKSDLQVQRSEIDALKRAHQPFTAPAAVALFGILLVGCIAVGRARQPG